jgi:hypothetical protein
VRAQRRRTKKLIVAFHFLKEDRAGWKCEQCRRQGLEATRRCGWLAEHERAPHKVVWARGRARAEECPVSLVSPQSVEWVERFFAWKLTGGGSATEMPAREADALLMLEKEWREAEHGQ